MNQIAITRTAHPGQPPADETLAFGKVFSDHMFLMNYETGKGWHNPRIEPYGPFTLDPACCVLHYGQAIFDGLKAFRGSDGQIRLFRLADHARRLNNSAHYLCIPELDPAMVEESIRALVGSGPALGALASPAPRSISAPPSSPPRPSSACIPRTATCIT